MSHEILLELVSPWFQLELVVKLNGLVLDEVKSLQRCCLNFQLERSLKGSEWFKIGPPNERWQCYISSQCLLDRESLLLKTIWPGYNLYSPFAQADARIERSKCERKLHCGLVHAGTKLTPVFGEIKTMSDWVADFSDGMNAGGCSEITEVQDDLSANDTTTTLPYRSEEICNPTPFDSEVPHSPRTHRNPDKTSDMKKPSKKRNWKKKIANCISKIGLRGKGSSSKHEESPCLAEFDSEARVGETDELSQLFRKSTSDMDKSARPQSWRKVLKCTSMRVPDEDKFTSDQSLQHYIESWN